MLFRFKGDYTGKRTSITLFGVTFEGREPADVTNADGIRRLSNHPEFEPVANTIAPAEALEKPRRGRPRKGG